jgi:hypothetical protein
MTGPQQALGFGENADDQNFFPPDRRSGEADSTIKRSKNTEIVFARRVSSRL